MKLTETTGLRTLIAEHRPHIEKLDRLYPGKQLILHVGPHRRGGILGAQGYIEDVISFAKEAELSFCDEFYLMTNEQDNEKLHISIINYDAADDSCLDAEKDLTGIIIFVNEKKAYDPEHDEKYYSPDELISQKLFGFPDEFILLNDLGESVGLEPYKIDK